MSTQQNERTPKTKHETRNEDYDVDLHVFLWEDPHEMSTLPEFRSN